MPTYFYASMLPQQFIDRDTQKPLSGGKLKAFISGSSTPTMMYSDLAGTEAGTEITLNAAGEPEVSGNVINIALEFDISYDFELENESAVSRWTTRYIAPSAGSSSNDVSNGTNGVDGINITQAVDNAANRPAVEDAIATNFDLTDVHARQVTFLTEDTAKVMTLNNADVTIDNAEIWITNASSTTHSFVAGTGTTFGFTELNIAAGKTVGLKRIGSTGKYYQLGCPS